jgi:hypothetical protein
LRRAALVLVALALTGCETNQQRSAKLERVAKQRQHDALAHDRSAQQGLSIGHPSTRVRVSDAVVVHGSEADAAVITLQNTSATTLRGVPIEITVKNAHGASLYTNATPGMAPTLVATALLPAHGSLTWIDDQVQASGLPASVSAEVGEGTQATGAVPKLTVEGAQLAEGAVEGNVVNHSHTSQQELVVYAFAQRAGKVVAAGRAVLAVAPAGASTHFELFLVGDAQGAQLRVSAPATTLG